jgi:hypothetical protein
MAGISCAEEWGARARALAERADALDAPPLGDDALTDPDGSVADVLKHAKELLDEVEATPEVVQDPQVRQSLDELARAAGRLQERHQRALEHLGERKAGLRQADRALKGYASTAGSEVPRFLNDKG